MRALYCWEYFVSSNIVTSFLLNDCAASLDIHLELLPNPTHWSDHIKVLIDTSSECVKAWMTQVSIQVAIYH